jgi:hypothetical protein
MRTEQIFPVKFQLYLKEMEDIFRVIIHPMTNVGDKKKERKGMFTGFC